MFRADVTKKISGIDLGISEKPLKHVPSNDADFTGLELDDLHGNPR
jgi:hypothetical protein